jgi:hypothetical protein
MTDSLPRHVKLARSLALASTLVLTACVASADSADPAAAGPDEGSGGAAEGAAVTPAALTLVEPAPPPLALPDAGAADADVPGSGKLSGPLPPPELPASFA